MLSKIMIEIDRCMYFSVCFLVCHRRIEGRVREGIKMVCGEMDGVDN